GTQVTTKTASVNGTASGSFTLPQARYGAHTISAVGLSSAENASASLSVVPGISLNPAFAYVESAIAPILSGFQSGETVDISIQNGPALKSVQVNSNGGASGSATNLTLPSTVQPGTVTLLARGQSSNAQSTTSLLVLAAGANTPTSTAAATSSPTETAQLDTRRVSTALNMRSGPGTSSNILQVLSAGTIVTVTGSGQNSGGLLFVPIRLQSGATGWVAERYLDPLAPTATATSGGNATATGTATMTATATTASSATATSTQTNNPQSDVRRVRTPLNMRTGPGTSSSILRVLQTGTMVTVTGQGVQSGSYMFVPIELQDGTDGWVAELYLEVMSSTATPAGSATATSTVPSNSMMTTVRLNLRSGPGTTYSSIEIMPAGTILTVTGPTQVGGSYIWAPVRKSNGVTGWAATDFLQSVAGPPPPAAEATQASDVTTVETAISAPVAPLRLDDAVLRWLPEIQSAAQRSGIPAQVIAGVISQTSGGDPNVTGLNGSAGLMMVSPDEFAALGVSTGWHDPATNLSAGASILAGLQSSSGSIEGALAAYFGDGCTSSGYCGADFAADVAASAAAYAPLVDDPANSGIAPLPSEWTAPPAAPYVMDGEVRPVFAPQQAQESDPEPTATEVAPTATSEPVSEEPTEAIEENTDPGQGDSEASPES
ncbi:MAG: SH3 domain-containing protein, partial [Thermomicrobiales bacterium]